MGYLLVARCLPRDIWLAPPSYFFFFFFNFFFFFRLFFFFFFIFFFAALCRGRNCSQKSKPIRVSWLLLLSRGGVGLKMRRLSKYWDSRREIRYVLGCAGVMCFPLFFFFRFRSVTPLRLLRAFSDFIEISKIVRGWHLTITYEGRPVHTRRNARFRLFAVTCSVTKQPNANKTALVGSDLPFGVCCFAPRGRHTTTVLPNLKGGSCWGNCDLERLSAERDGGRRWKKIFAPCWSTRIRLPSQRDLSGNKTIPRADVRRESTYFALSRTHTGDSLYKIKN